MENFEKTDEEIGLSSREGSSCSLCMFGQTGRKSTSRLKYKKKELRNVSLQNPMTDQTSLAAGDWLDFQVHSLRLGRREAVVGRWEQPSACRRLLLL